jgi:phosphoribosylamine--glycine ligase
VVFHSGTAIRDGELITAGGRVLALTSMHPDWKTALDQSYGMASGISFEGMYFRRDIGFDL